MTNNTRKLLPEEAIALICMCAIQADTRIRSTELKKLTYMIALSPLYRHIKDPVEYISSLNREFSGQEVEKIINDAIDALSPSLCETAYAWAYEIVMSDLGVSQDEHVYLNLLVKKMGINGNLAGKIGVVIAILNRKG